MKKIYSLFALFLMLLSFGGIINAQDKVSIVSWDFTSATGSDNTSNYGPNELAPTETHTNIIAGGLTRSAALETNVTEQTTTLNIWGSRDFNTTNTTVFDANSYEERAAEAISEGKYFTFTITPESDATVSIAGVDEYKAKANGSIRMRWQYQVGDGDFKTIDVRNLGTDVLDYSLGTASSGTTCSAFSLTDSLDLQNVDKTITFRVIIYQGGQRSNVYAAGFYNSNLTIKGFVNLKGMGINNNEVNSANVNVQGKTIYVQAADALSASVYSISGKLISTKAIESGNVSFDIEENGVYIVKVGNKTSKVIL